jgi:NAD(P)-dependent dehydrogenase (short-subunit alcohol dehydrogenase family)
VLHEEWVKEWGDRAEDRIERMKRVYPMAHGLDRLGLPGDAAFAVACFCCTRAEWTTGQTVSVSGGYTMVP